MKRFQAIYDIAEICAQRGVHQAVLCPGSRCAPLTLAFARHPDITARTFSDERSAAFIGLGIAQQSDTPTVLVCTSGSAAYNFAPAIAESFYSETPLLVFTADRPKAWINQGDGQAIQQNEIYGNHVKKSFCLPEDYDHPDSVWHIGRIINEAISIATQYPAGPVHINAPFREPFYPTAGEEIVFNKKVRIVSNDTNEVRLTDSNVDRLKKSFASFHKVLIVAGQGEHDENLLKSVEKFMLRHHAPLVGDIISNFHGLPGTIRLADSFLGQPNEGLKKTLRPELLITFGMSVISKNLKLFLRTHKPQQHWHIQESGINVDTFQSVTELVNTTPDNFFVRLLTQDSKQSGFGEQKRQNYYNIWEAEEHRTIRTTQDFLKDPALTELLLVHEILKALPKRCNLHLANSMSVRYANLFGLPADKNGVHVFANRGTSGIDGCTSTAVGHVLASDIPNFLITGDMAFFYDRNAFWHNYPLPNLRVIVLNNHGGIIFSMIDGPAALPERDMYFVTQQKLNAGALASEFGFDLLKLTDLKKLKHLLKDFYEFSGNTKILELESKQDLNKSVFEKLKVAIGKEYA